MKTNKIYWKNIDQLDSNNQQINKIHENEFVSKLPVDHNKNEDQLDNSHTRRDFLKYLGYSTAAATIAACEGPVIKSVPYVIQPEQITPGIANYYATTIADGYDFASVLIKTREGRPIKVQNNNQIPYLGCANARVNASVLSLYDSLRIQGPKYKGKDISWSDFYDQTSKVLKSLSKDGEKVVLMTNSLASPSTEKIISEFLNLYPNISHVVYDPISSDSALNAFEKEYGIRALPDYDFSIASNIISFDADILGDWQGGGYESGYSKSRIPNKKNFNKKYSMSWHIQLESNMSLSGANADKRVPLKPSDIKNILFKLYSKLASKKTSISLSNEHQKLLDQILNKINKSPSNSVVVSGIDDDYSQRLVLAINSILKSKAFNINTPRFIRKGKNDDVKKLLNEMKSGEVKGLIISGLNPVYSLPNGSEFKDLISSLKFSLVFSSKEDETSSVSEYIASTPHQLESWGDYEFKYGHYALAQPTIRPIFDTNQFQDVLLKLMNNNISFYDYIKEHWNESILEGHSWNKALHDGYLSKRISLDLNRNKDFYDLDISEFSNFKDKGLSLILYSKTGIGDGQQANNPWLQEFPDPITRVTWDNYLTVSMVDAKEIGLKNENTANGALNGSYANIKVGNKSINVPVIIQPGQAEGTVGLAFGYGKSIGVKDEMKIGVNAFNFYNGFNKVQEININPIDDMHEFACVQLHNTLMGRGDIFKETTLEIFNTKDKKYWNAPVTVSKNHIETIISSPEVDMYEEFDSSIGHHFNLSIDLNACTGCGACVIACHSENNVPVVGKREVRKSRDMHWLRIDRYYSSENTFEKDNKTKDDISGLSDSLTVLGNMEKSSEKPQVAFQPVMCQHCNHAPCETVCPVAATSHGRQGQNHMAYNRCVGTRYCANNCPYKVRRFNWFLYNGNDEFDYHMNDDLGRMVINPDVVVRSRGVMEKCSFCIQLTQKTILDAKLEGREIKDGDFYTACSNACSTGAMVFGDVNDKESKVSELKKNDRMYHLLEAVGTKPNVMYQTKIRNIDET